VDLISPKKLLNFLPKKIDLYQILMSVNIFFLLLVLSTLSFSITTPFYDITNLSGILVDSYVHYIDRESLFYYLLISIQVHFSLKFAKNKNNFFILIVNYYLLFYYLLRIASLAYTGYSPIFDVYFYGPSVDDVNFTLKYIFLANFFIYFGFSIFSNYSFDFSVIKKNLISPVAVNLFLIVYGFFIFIEFNDMGRIFLSTLTPFFPPLILFLAPIIYMFLGFIIFIIYRKYLSRVQISIFISLTLYFIGGSIIEATRSIPIFALETIFIFLCILKVKFTRAIYLSILFITPLVLFFFFLLFSYSTEIRAQKHTFDSDIIHEFVLIRHTKLNYYEKVAPRILKMMFNRIGYLDATINIQQHNQKYEKLVNLKVLGKSFVDNALTPSFDVFDHPKMANSLVFLYKNYNQGIPSKKVLGNTQEFYQSDILTLYGELYLYFGYMSFFIFMVWALIGNLFINKLHFKNNFFNLAFKIFIILFTIRSFNSFGLDWVFHEIVPFLVVIIVFSLVNKWTLKL